MKSDCFLIKEGLKQWNCTLWVTHSSSSGTQNIYGSELFLHVQHSIKKEDLERKKTTQEGCIFWRIPTLISIVEGSTFGKQQEKYVNCYYIISKLANHLWT